MFKLHVYTTSVSPIYTDPDSNHFPPLDVHLQSTMPQISMNTSHRHIILNLGNPVLILPSMSSREAAGVPTTFHSWSEHPTLVSSQGDWKA